MLRRLILVVVIMFAVAAATGPIGVSLFCDSPVMAAEKCPKCGHEKCPVGADGKRDCSKCPDCGKKGY